jgi:hypothetical protein
MYKNKIYMFIFLILFSNLSLAEIYKDFLPNDSLAIIKTKYPNAKLEDIKAAWVKENESFIGLSGVGIVGAINLKFSHNDEFKKEMIKYYQNKIAENPLSDNSNYELSIQYMNEALNAPLDNRLTLDWLRWVSPEPIPFERLVSKYGNPEKCDFDPDSFLPICSWTSKGLTANLSDDKKYVYSIEYGFTEEDWGIKNTDKKQNNEPKVKEKPSKKSKLKKL